MEKITTSGNLPSYKTQFDKITEAYIRGEIKPLDAKFCFCGTLCDNSTKWAKNPEEEHNDFAGYLGNDFVRMEKALLTTSFNYLWDKTGGGILHAEELHPQEYEDALFNGMTAALKVLKQIHIQRGEIIDETPVFIKRTSNTLAV